MVTQFTGNTYQPSQTFDIRNFIDTLTPAKEKNKYICPVCEIDKAAAILHLETLGYSRGDQVCIRYINPSTSKATKADGLEFKQMEQLQSQGFNAYVVVNPGGHSDNDITAGRVIFYEHDNIDKSVQADLWQSLRLPEPSLQVYTGGKSVHSYWVLSEPVDVPTWTKLQSDLLDFSDADRTIKNPSRVMRLAGSLYINKSGEAVGVAQIIRNSGKKYTLEELRRIIPEKSAVSNQQLPITNYQSPITNHQSPDIPLYQCLSKGDRDLIDNGIGEGGRNASGAKLARNLIGTANRLQHLGHRFEGDPRQVFDDYCSHCSPPLDTREAEVIWKSASNDNPTATLTDDAIENCIKAWQKNQGVKNHQTQSPIKNNVVPHPTLKTSEELIKQIDLLISKDLARSELEAIIPDIAKQCDRHPADVWKLYKARVKEQEQLEDRKQTTKQLPTLLDAQKTRLDPYELFWSDGGIFAHTLMGMAENMPTAVEHLITTLIPAAGSRIGTSSRIVINPSAKYTQPAIFWTCMVAGTGQLKTPTQQNILSPLHKLEAEEYRAWKLENDEYKRDLQAYKKSKDKDAEPPEPPEPRRRFVVTSATSEARIKIHGENPRGILNYRDEWSGFINGRNKYRKGSGDDLEQDLSEFNGDVLSKDLVKSDDCVYLEKSAISRTGNTQPETLKNLQSKNNFEDFQGEFSRWLFCLVDSKPAYIDLFRNDQGLGNQLDDLLTNLYKGLGALPEQDYLLDIKAKQHFQTYQHQLINWSLEENHPGLKATYPKMQSYLARLALFLHLVNAVLIGATPDPMIGEYAMYTACKMVDFYLAQARLVYALNSPQHELAGNYLKVKQFIDKRGKATVRDIRSGIAALKPLTAADVTVICDELVNQGVIRKQDKYYTSTSKDDNDDVMMMKYRNFNNPSNDYSVSNTAITENSNDDSDDAMMMDNHQPQSSVQQGFKDLENKNDDDFSVLHHHLEFSTDDGLHATGFASGDDGVRASGFASTDDELRGTGFASGDDELRASGFASADDELRGTGFASTDDGVRKKIITLDDLEPESLIPQRLDGDDKVSSNIIKSDLLESEPAINQGLETDDKESPKHHHLSSSSSSLEYEVEDNVLFYATVDHAERKKQTKGTIVDIQYEHGYLVQCQVEYLDKKGDRLTATIGGGSAEWLLRKVR
jgi:hypothetical protein